MTPATFRFDRFWLDSADRQLRCDGQPVELNARYLDALTLLVREAGRLVSKDRFLDEVWRGVPVTDEALTQCIRTLRRQLGDDAATPRFIETVPKHGYRFIAAVESGESARAVSPRRDWRQVLQLGVAGTLGGGVAGFLGGLFYGFAAASQPLQPGMGAVSVLLVIVCLTVLVALIGGAGVGFGIALTGYAHGRRNGALPGERWAACSSGPSSSFSASMRSTCCSAAARAISPARSRACFSEPRSGSVRGWEVAPHRSGEAPRRLLWRAPPPACSSPCSAGA